MAAIHIFLSSKRKPQETNTFNIVQ